MERWDRETQRALDAANQRLIAARIRQGIATRQDHARNAILRRGRRVRCVDCGHEERLQTWSGRRLRQHACADCGGRLRPRNWPGFAAVVPCAVCRSPLSCRCS